MSKLSDISDEDLLVERRPGKAGPTFEAFHVRHERAVLAYFARRVNGAEVAADLMAETFTAALASRRQFQPRGENSAVGWLYGIARHTLSRSVRRGSVEDRARRQMGVPRAVLDDEDLHAIDELMGGPGLMAAREGLPPGQRDAVREHVLDEDEYAVIAARLSCSEAAIRKRVSRGLARLRRLNEESR